MQLTPTEENYVKAIYHVQQKHGKAGTNQLATALKTSAASISDMLGKLEAKELLHYKKYHGFMLSEKGRQLALGVIRNHRLWEYFLVHKLGFAWGAVHNLAEELEHVSSTELISRLDQYLGHPAFDPHGDPIPDAEGRMPLMQLEPLHLLEESRWARVQSVNDQSNEMLDLLNHYGIGLGTRLCIEKKFAFDGSLQIILDTKTSIQISREVAQHIYCTYA